MYRRGRHVGTPLDDSRTPSTTDASNGRNLGPRDRVPTTMVGAQALREELSSPKGKFEGPVNPDRVAASRWRRTGLREVRVGQRRVVTMESQASLEHFSGALGQIERGTVESIASGQIRVDIESCKERVAVRCLTCLHQIWVRGKDGQLRVNFRKSDRKIMGYLISAQIPKGKQCRQIVCLSCIHKLLGMVTENSDGLSVTLSSRNDGGQDTTILRRQTGEGAWSQTFELTDVVLSYLSRENVTTGLGQRPVATAASQIGERGMAKGVRPRARGHRKKGVAPRPNGLWCRTFCLLSRTCRSAAVGAPTPLVCAQCPPSGRLCAARRRPRHSRGTAHCWAACVFADLSPMPNIPGLS
ncbi:hypothetical protein KFL_004570010, partial [Klebsormidium nitens]